MEKVVLIPGYLAPPAGFRSLAEALAGFEAVELARSPDPAGPDRPGEIPPGAHVVAFAEAAGRAARLAAEGRAGSLTLFSPILRSDAALAARLKTLRTAQRAGPAALAEAAAPWFFGAFMLEQGQEAVAVWGQHLAELELGAWLEAMLALPDGRKAMRRLACPVLVALGAEDAFTPLRYGQEAVEWTPPGPNGLGAVRVSLEGCGHLAPWENPLEAASLVEGFIHQAEGVAGAGPRWDELPIHPGPAKE